jgi:hypothetical protein
MNRKEIIGLCLAVLILAIDVAVYVRQASVAGEITLCLPVKKVKP